ncbi:hypothetical protein ACFYWY_06805 [Streptomyces sp. NPDC002870]|uniref:hypothetical protein n=1 Tax=Streptomyces sp. NPDC002870 TaxID=3364666 RepID=UPI00369DF0F9
MSDEEPHEALAGALHGEDPHEALRQELRGLGRGITIPDVDGETMAERVLAQLLAEAVPPPAVPRRAERFRRWTRRRWRALTVALSGVLVVLVLTPPVRAAVADWFGFGGVEVRYDPTMPPRPGTQPPWCHAPVPLAEAERRAGFRARVPGGLGDPDAVSVTEGPAGRSVVSLCWSERGRTIRLDQFPARLDLGFAKQARLIPEWVTLSGGTGLWFAEPHLLRFGMTDARGEAWTQSERTAGPTLLWMAADERTTLRLEGVAQLPRAKEIAESTR